MGRLDDIDLSGIGGIETLRRIKSGHPLVEVIMLTDHASVEVAEITGISPNRVPNRVSSPQIAASTLASTPLCASIAASARLFCTSGTVIAATTSRRELQACPSCMSSVA